MEKTKILFTHNTAMWYRIPFFREIAKIYDLDLVFTHFGVIEDIYDEEANNKIKGLEDVDYSILKNSHGFAKGLINKANSDYDVLIGGSWDTIQELTESIFLYMIVKLRKKKMIIWREDWDWEKENSLKEKLLFKVTKYLCNHVDRILVPGSLHKSYFNKKMGVPSDKISIMPNVSNINQTKYNKPDTNTKKILYVGRLIERKGIFYLIDAYKDLKIENKELIIVGSGSEEEKLKNYIKDNNIKNVEFTGKISNDQLTEYYKNSNIVVIPSINKGMGDPWVFVLNEAMNYSKPVIASTAVGAAPDMIQGNGFIVEEKNANQLEEAMYKILINPELEEEMSRKSREIIDTKFQYKNMIDNFVDCIKKI